MLKKTFTLVKMILMVLFLALAVFILSAIGHAEKADAADLLGAERLIVEQGLGSSGLLSDSTLEGNIPLDRLSRSRIGLEWELFSEPEGIALDFGLGLHAYSASGQPSTAMGVDTTLRLTFGPELRLSPYVIFTASYDELGETWSGTDVDYSFTNTFGAGMSYRIDDSSSLYLDYRWFHTSNGSSFHSDSFREFFSLEKSENNPGFESGLITLGYSFEF